MVSVTTINTFAWFAFLASCLKELVRALSSAMKLIRCFSFHCLHVGPSRRPGFFLSTVLPPLTTGRNPTFPSLDSFELDLYELLVTCPTSPVRFHSLALVCSSSPMPGLTQYENFSLNSLIFLGFALVITGRSMISFA